MKKMITIILFSLAILLHISLQASSVANKKNNSGFTAQMIEGIVLDIDGNPVYGAEVIIPQKKISKQTDQTGKYIFHVEDGGNIHIEVYKEGYLPAVTEKFPIGIMEKRVVSKITISPVPMEEIVVTGTATPKLYREAPVKTFIAPKETIEKIGAQNLADSLEIVTGVRVEDNCQNCNFTQVRINGMDGKYCQILINSMPMVSALAGVYALEQIPANAIEKLEVVKGGGSSLYGGNAIGGVVNVMLREPTKTNTTISIQQGMIKDTPNTKINLNYDYVSPNNMSLASFFASFQRKEPLDYNGDGFSDVGEMTNLSIGSGYSHFFEGINGKLKVNFAAISEDRRGGNKFDLPEHFADIAESVKTNRIDFSSGWEQVFTEKALLKINTSFAHTKRKSYYGSEQDPNAYGQTLNPVFYGEIQYLNFALKNHAIIVGSSFKSDSIEDSAPAYDRLIDETYTDLGFYLQDEISLGKKLKFLFGARGDRHSEIESIIFSPRASLSFTGIKNTTLRLTYSTGFRAPQIFDEDLHITQVGGNGMIIKNKDGLREERSYSITVGLDYGKMISKSAFRFSIGGFFNRLNGVFTLHEIDITENARVFERFNGDGARVYGIEGELGFNISGNLEIFTGWTYQKSLYDTPEPDFRSTRMFRSPNLYGSIRLDWDLLNIFDLNLDLSHTGLMVLPHYSGFIDEDILETTESFTVLNITLNTKIRTASKQKVTITASVFNVFNAYQKDLDKGPYRDAGYIYGPRIPRTVRLGINYNF